MADELSRAQKIALLQKQGITPPSSDIAPKESVELTRDQKIKALTDAGVSIPQTAAPQGGGFLEQHPTVANYIHGAIDALPTAGAVMGGIGGAMAGAAGGTAVLPGVGTLAGASELGIAGTGAGAAVGSLAKDSLNAWIFGETKGSSAANLLDAGTESAKSMLMQKGGELVAKGVGALAEKFVPPSVIARYRKAAASVMALTNDNNGNIAQAADELKGGMQQSLDEFRGEMNQRIGQELSQSTKRIDPSPVLEELAKARNAVDMDLVGGAAKKQEIDELIQSVRNKFDENGQIFVEDAHKLKQFLQQQATDAYRNGTAGEAAEAAKGAAARMRLLVNKAEPGVASANNKLWELHSIEDNMNKQLFKEGGAESGLIAAGKYTPGKMGGSARNFTALKNLEEITGKSFVSGAQDLAAMEQLGNAKPSLGATGNIPFAIRKSIDIGNSTLGQSLGPLTGRTLSQAGGRLSESVMRGSGAMESLKQIGSGE